MLNWSMKMAKRITAAVRQFKTLPRVHLIPIPQSTISDPLRLKEISELVARIVLHSNKRGRPSKQLEEGYQDAA